MNAALLKERFLAMLAPPRPSDWEAEENLEPLLGLPEPLQALILQQVPAIWPVSNSLCYSYLSCGEAAFSCLEPEQAGAWVAAILDIYEKKGLKAAQAFMTDIEANFLCRLRGETGLRLAEVTARLLPYAKGLARRPIALEEGADLATDTARIFLPGKVAIFPSEAENFLLYKLMVTSQLALIAGGAYELEISPDSALARAPREARPAAGGPSPINLEGLWNVFPEPRLAEDLFTLAEGWRLNAYLAAFFPGLWRDTIELRGKLAARRRPITAWSGKSRLVETLCRHLLIGSIDQATDSGARRYRRVFDLFRGPAPTALASAAKAAAIYALLHEIPAPYEPVPPLPYLGRLDPAAAQRVRLRERAATRQKFIEALAAILPAPPPPAKPGEDAGTGEPGARLTGDDATALLITPAQHDEPESPAPTGPDAAGQLLLIDGPDVEIPEALKELAAAINRDLGQIPDDYIVAAHGLAGKGEPPLNIDVDPAGERLRGGITYDEWDYRRAGFRKDWCRLNEKRIQPVKGTFVKTTLAKYRGLLLKLKKQFEMLRCTERLLKRQRDGDDIDLDALIESLSDQRAGRPESEKLFLRLHRDARDIAVLFLIDMSSSTEGWVGEALKEALILMGEALEVLGDRYAIAGFSGMRRSRSDFYHIKDFAEAYNDEIKGRIAAITPREYTRMGPPVRHAAGMLQAVEARVRLLIILTDGKPEDYDDYKGEYAIEDTRHALLEARAAGIHSFGINIDQQAHDYNARMYGEANYIFLDKVSDLPIRMPAIYRNLTT
jgi:nitric oxide reductase NorD protein